jgi:hypothetical protein
MNNAPRFNSIMGMNYSYNVNKRIYTPICYQTLQMNYNIYTDPNYSALPVIIPQLPQPQPSTVYVPSLGVYAPV